MIFDLDGTLVQTERLKALSYAKAVRELRPEVAEHQVIDAFRDFVGLSRQEVAAGLLARFDLGRVADGRRASFGVTTGWQVLLQLRLGHYEALVHADGVLLAHRWPHNLALLERARQTCDKVGLATMSHCREVRHVLGVLGLMDRFDFVASRDDVEHGKPAPEIYLLVAAQLGSLPAECLVIEDSVAGVRAARAAGMPCIAVGTDYTRDALHRAGVLEERWIVDDPAEIFRVVEDMMKDTNGAVT
ncbi:MAG: HAD family phosphatase [Gemmatimonadetes bacterium]|nr:HAD family phosphatase [Gemmatimonadota bacterium]